jgi:hypothetical protein
MKVSKICVFIIIQSFLIGMVACKKEKLVLPNKFERKWFSIDGHLKIDSTNKFEYVYNNSVSQSVSNGTWKVVNDTLVLNSFAPKGCYFIENFNIEPPKDTSQIISNPITEKGCEPNIGYVIFKNEKFYIKDTLLMSKYPTFDNGKFNPHTNFRKTSYYQK